mmetsp:Transcript_2016/g.5459  ORF Transcript_2016/g.5459 Transcript_2016/m.5459 type:complete len:126 (-) Transcript_2016:643-1020(-)|eukprot:scaffold32882_cov29-Tisochrysis_lutea.AAC.2
MPDNAVVRQWPLKRPEQGSRASYIEHGTGQNSALCLCGCARAYGQMHGQLGGLPRGGQAPNRSLVPAAVERGAAVSQPPQPLQVALPAVLAHGVGRGVALAAPRETAVEANTRIRLRDATVQQPM